MSEDPFNSADTPAPHPATSVAPGSGLPSRQAAGLASLFSLPGGLVFYFLDRKDPFVRYYAVQAIVLGLILGAGTLMTELGNFIFGHLWLIGWIFLWVIRAISTVFELVWMAVWILTTVSAFKARQWPVPYLTPVVKRLSTRMT